MCLLSSSPNYYFSALLMPRLRKKAQPTLSPFHQFHYLQGVLLVGWEQLTLVLSPGNQALLSGMFSHERNEP